MAWDDWKDGYDSWKLASPDDYYDDDPDEDCCEHEDYEADVLTGRAFCYRCGHTWWQTSEELAAESRRQAAYAQWIADQEQPWFRFKDWLRAKICGLRHRLQRRSRPTLAIDDDIPF